MGKEIILQDEYVLMPEQYKELLIVLGYKDYVEYLERNNLVVYV